MAEETENSKKCDTLERFGGNIRHRPDDSDMAKEDRRQQVLEFMKEYPLAYSPLILYRNLKLHRQITFSIDSLRNYLEEFAEEGLVLRVKKEPLDDGRVVEAEGGSRPYYLISDEGRSYLENM